MCMRMHTRMRTHTHITYIYIHISHTYTYTYIYIYIHLRTFISHVLYTISYEKEFFTQLRTQHTNRFYIQANVNLMHAAQKELQIYKLNIIHIFWAFILPLCCGIFYRKPSAAASLTYTCESSWTHGLHLGRHLGTLHL